MSLSGFGEVIKSVSIAVLAESCITLPTFRPNYLNPILPFTPSLLFA